MTQPLDEFRADYEADDNVWWRTECGDHMNLFDQALERIDELATQNAELRDSLVQVTSIVDELTRQRDDARRMVVDAGYFQDHRGEDYSLGVDVSDGEMEYWGLPIGQEQQR